MITLTLLRHRATTSSVRSPSSPGSPGSRASTSARPGSSATDDDDPDRLYYIALGVAVLVYVLIRFVVRTPFGLALQGVRDEPVRMSSLGYAVPMHRTLAFGVRGVLRRAGRRALVWWQGQIAPGTIGLQATIDLLIVAVIGGLGRIEGAWVGALAFIVINNYVRDSWLTRFLDDVRIGGSFNTIIGLDVSRHSHRLPRRLDGALGAAVAESVRRRGGGTERPPRQPSKRMAGA